MITLPKYVILAAGLSGLSACAGLPDRQDPAIAPPAAWSAAGPEQGRIAGTATGIEQAWWKAFDDPVLDGLIGKALSGNKSLQVAKARILEARAGQDSARAALMPVLNGTAQLSRGNQGYATSDKAISIREADLAASWEVDVFGKNRARAGEAAAIAQSVEADAQALTVTLLAEVARDYFELRNEQEQIRITRENLETQQKTLELIRAQKAGALSSDLDVERAAAQVSTTSAQLPALEAALAATRHRLAVLMGETPESLADPALDQPGTPRPVSSAVVVAAPARVLANRPDIRAAERRFAASIAASDAATRAFFPTLSLTALFGVQDSTAFSTQPWSIGAGLVQPILDFGRIQAQVDAADARQTQAFLTYQQTVLEALEDMENALASYLQETRRQHDLDLAANENRRAVILANEQYKAGYSGLLDLLVAQHDALAAQSALAASDAQLRKNLVAIYTAAGGGWAL